MITSTTQRLYYKDTYQDTAEAKIIDHRSDEKGSYAIFDQTIFHPQGGGQPSDKGSFQIGDTLYTVTSLVESKGNDQEIKHYYSPTDDTLVVAIDQIATLKINKDERILYARYHTAGHLFANVVQELYPDLDGVRGNHFPGGQAFVVLSKPAGGKVDNLTTAQKEQIVAKVNEYVAKNLKVNILFDDKGNRSIQIDGFKAYPCGGTHVANTGEIGTFSIRSMKREKNDLKVGYNLA